MTSIQPPFAAPIMPPQNMQHASPDEYYDENGSEPDSGEDAHDLSNGASSPSTASKAQPVKTLMQKRRRVTRACDECRRKKIKCDGKQPCTHCTVYSYDCTYDQPSNRRRNPAPQYVENLEHRVHRAETLLHILIPNLDLNDPGIDAAVAQGWIPGAPGKGNPSSAQHQLPQPPTSAPQNKPDTNLESMVRAVAQMDLDEQGNWDYHGHSSGLSFMRRMREQLGDLMGPDSPATPFVKSRPRSQVLDSPRSTFDSPSADSPGTDLPSRDLARQLCTNAIEHAAALLKIIHQPTFWASFDRIYSLPAEQWTDDEQRFLPLLYSAIALGCLFSKDEQAMLSRSGYENAIQHGFAYFKAARQMMDIADCRDLTSVQAVIFMIMFMQSSAKLSQCYAYIGVALRSALRMGLHRSLPGNFDPIESETRKRVFWVIRKMDIYVGAMLGLPQTLSDDDIDQDLPTEVDDEYITKDGIQPMPEGTLSTLAAFNAHTRLIQLLQKIVRKVYPIKVQGQADKSYTVPFSVIREIESDLERWKDSLNPELNPCETNSRFTRVQHLLRLAYAHAQVLLYRPFLHFVAAGKREKPIDQRAYACAASYVNVSRNIVHITTQMKNNGLLNGAFWFIMYTSFFSILSLVYFAAENPDNPTTEAVMRDAIEGKEVLASLAARSMAADRCTVTLDGIFARLPDWMREGRQNPSNSRKRQMARSSAVGRSHLAQSHPDVQATTPDLAMFNQHKRANTFPRQATAGQQGPTSSASSSFDTYANAGAGAYGSPANPANGLTLDFPPPSTTPTSATPIMANGLAGDIQQFALQPNFGNLVLPDVSAMMFPGGGDEPFNYPNQPLTTFENNQQVGKSMGILSSQQATPHSDYTRGLENPAMGMTPSSHGGRDDNLEAQFFPLPPFMQAQQARHHQQTSFPMDPVSFTGGPGPASHMQSGAQTANSMQQLPNGGAGAWQMGQFPQQQQRQNQQQQQTHFAQDMGGINIQELFGGAEWHPVMQ